MSNEAPKTEVATGTISVHFLKTDTIPERKALGRKEGSGEWTQVAKALAEKPGRVAEVYFTSDIKEASSRRSALIQAAERAGLEMNLAKTAVRDSGKKDAEGKVIFCVFACAATDEVKANQAKVRAAKAAALKAAAEEKGMTLEQYKASLPRRGRAPKQ